MSLIPPNKHTHRQAFLFNIFPRTISALQTHKNTAFMYSFSGK